MGLTYSCFHPLTRRRTRKRVAAHSSAVKVTPAAGTNTFPPTSAGNGLHTVTDHSKTNYDGENNDVKVLNSEKDVIGESSNDAPPFICEICTETKTAWESFTATTTTCSHHAFCSECVFTYVSSKLQQNQINITCPIPECTGLLEAEDCRAILPPEVVDRWLTALCEAIITASEKFYCPFVDCSAMLIDDGVEKVTESECPNCRRLFCAQCKVPWHNEVTCEEFQKMNQEEKGLVVKLAKEMKKCPNCRFYIAKSDDCEVIRCRCGYAECSDTAGEGESSNAAPFICEICTETKTAWESFGITGCSHAYCSDCVAMYVRSKVEENVINIKCPVSGCSGLLEAEDCRAILPEEVFDRWGKAASEAMIAESEKFYCPFANCSALLIDDGRVKVSQSECPDCRRLFCAQCKVPWHAGVTCVEYQKLGKDDRGKEDLMLIKLAKDKKWRRCPNCKLYVAKSEGCMYMRCRCGHTFCYNCGTPNLNKKSHYCDTCRRTY